MNGQLEEAIRMNNSIVDELRHGRYKEALAQLSGALHLMRDHCAKKLVKSSRQQGEPPEKDLLSGSDVDMEEYEVTPHSLEVQLTAANVHLFPFRQEDPEDLQQEQGYFLFDRVLTITPKNSPILRQSPHHNTRSDDNGEDRLLIAGNLLCSCIILNLALIHHSLAATSVSSTATMDKKQQELILELGGTKNLSSRAEQLYLHALRIVTSMSMRDDQAQKKKLSAQSLAPLVPLLMGLEIVGLNNLAQLQSNQHNAGCECLTSGYCQSSMRYLSSMVHRLFFTMNKGFPISSSTPGCENEQIAEREDIVNSLFTAQERNAIWLNVLCWQPAATAATA